MPKTKKYHQRMAALPACHLSDLYPAENVSIMTKTHHRLQKQEWANTQFTKLHCIPFIWIPFLDFMDTCQYMKHLTEIFVS